MVRLRDLGGGEPNDALTGALFDDSVDAAQADHPEDDLDAHPDAADPAGAPEVVEHLDEREPHR